MAGRGKGRDYCMAIVEVRDLKAELRILGLDVGTKTIGLALSDLTRTVATPLRTIRRARFAEDASEIRAVVGEMGVDALVIGLPVSMDGTEGPRCQSVRQFAADLLETINMPAAFWDERLSTAAVERMLISEADLSRKRRAQVVDKAAAAYILQGALDAMGSGG